MEEGDVVLSDVHVGTSHSDELPTIYASSHEIKVGLSRFQFKFPPPPTSHATSIQQAPHAVTMATDEREHLNYDEDGDAEVTRNYEKQDVITIEHGLASPLGFVGLQVWNGSLLLSDYCLHIHHELCGKTVLELGAGSGLTSIVIGKFAKHVICTDTKDEVLQMCQKNVQRNTHLGNIIVRDLDWCKSDPFQTGSTEWCWSKDDLETLQNTDLIIAADVIYSNELTDSFFGIIKSLLQVSRPVTAIISLEKRLNFTLEELEICCPAYNHFITWTQKLKNDQSPLTVVQIPVNFPQYFIYERTKYLEIWKITNAATTPDN